MTNNETNEIFDINKLIEEAEKEGIKLRNKLRIYIAVLIVVSVGVGVLIGKYLL